MTRPPAPPSSLKSAPKIPKLTPKQSAAQKASSKVLGGVRKPVVKKSGIKKVPGGETSSAEVTFPEPYTVKPVKP